MNDYTLNPPQEQQKINRSIRYKRLSIAQELASTHTGHAIRFCLSRPTGVIKVHRNIKDGKAFYTGLQTCGSVWDCPVCSAKISYQRGEELRSGINNWLAGGGYVVMVTFTVSHDLSNSLKELSTVLTNAIRFVHSGAPWKRISNKYDIVGSVTATEVLFNKNSGWHFHKHQLLFFRKELNNLELEKWIYARYEKYLELAGYYSRDGIGVKVSNPVQYSGELPEYLTKWGLDAELTAVNNKDSGGLTPFELLDDPDLYSRYIEYSKTMIGKRRLTWSKGLRLILGLQENELTDEQLSEAVESILDQSVELIIIPNLVWKYILINDLRVKILEKAECDIGEFQSWFLDKVTLPAYRKDGLGRAFISYKNIL